jgi:hypothetical protein
MQAASKENETNLSHLLINNLLSMRTLRTTLKSHYGKYRGISNQNLQAKK